MDGSNLRSDLSILADVHDHPAFPSFAIAMKGRAYGREALVTAWAWYRKGWADRSLDDAPRTPPTEAGEG